MRHSSWMGVAIAVTAVACGGSGDGSSTAKQCAEPGLTCNDGLCFNGAANGVCDQNGQCRTEPSTTGDCVLFVTSGTYGADLGGLAGADATCQRSAEAAGLKGTFKAWLSDSRQSAAQRLTHAAVPYIDTRGQLVASEWKDLTDGSLQRALTVDEKGYDWDADAKHCGIAIVVAKVWTGTTTSGDASGPFCGDWTSVSDTYATTGYYCYASEAWTDPSIGIQSSCTASLSLYCVQQ